MSSPSEAVIKAAIQEVKNGKSIRKSASLYGISRQLLTGRLNGRGSRHEAAAAKKRLTNTQEAGLVDWILFQDQLGCAPTHDQIRQLASKLLLNQESPSELGKNWVYNFIQRHSRIKTLRSRSIDSKRLDAARPSIFRPWFTQLDAPEVQEILPENRWNMDEMGIMEGQGQNGLVVGSAEKQQTIKKHSGIRTWTSILEAINALGKALPPLVIFKGKSVQQQWFPEELEFLNQWAFEASDNGWTSTEIGLQWLIRVFVPLTKLAEPNHKRLLVLDGYLSYISDDFIIHCITNRI